MVKVTTEQARQRFKTLPQPVQDAIFSVQTAEIVSKISEDNHLPKEKVPPVAESLGLVLLGFIHPGDLPKEIQERTLLPAPLAAAIAGSLESRVFGNLKSDLERIYAPPTEGPLAPPPSPPGVIEEVKPAAPPSPVSGLDPPPLKIRDLGGVAAPKPLSELGAPPSAVPPPLPAGQPPAPFVIHKEFELEPLKSKPEFRLEVAPPKPPSPPPGAGLPQKPAEIEIGLPKEAAKPQVARTEISPPKVIHYTQWKTPAAGEPKPSGEPAPIRLSELHPSPLKPPAPPPPNLPVAPPKPERPPPQENVVNLTRIVPQAEPPAPPQRPSGETPPRPPLLSPMPPAPPPPAPIPKPAEGGSLKAGEPPAWGKPNSPPGGDVPPAPKI